MAQHFPAMKRDSRYLRLAVLLFGGCAFSSNCAEHDLFGPAFNLVAENDMVVRTDRHYTHGTKLTLLGGEVAVARESAGFNFPVWLAERTPDLGAQSHAARLGVALGQSIYTPTDISTPAIQLNDRPYAGVLYASLLLQKRGATAGGTPVLDNWRLDLGVIGPESQAEEAQNTVHRVRNLGVAMGWANELKTEPALALRFQRTWRAAQGESGDWGWDFLPAAGVSIGNLGTYAVLATQVRAGWRLPGDFGVQTIDAISAPSMGRSGAGAKDRGVYAFAGLEGHAVAYSAFLDGNLWRASHNVVKFPLVADAKFGVMYSGRRFDFSLTQVLRTKEFVGQREIDAYGALAFSVKWDPPVGRATRVKAGN